MGKKVIFGCLIMFILGITLGVFVMLSFFAFNGGEEELNELENYGEYTIKSKLVAVDEQGEGVTADLITEIREGNGLVLVNINDLLADVNTQYSARIAASVASNYTKVDLRNLDVIFNLKADASIVGGQSAGAIMTISTIAALQNKTLKEGVIITGSVSPDGEVVNAGGLKAKALAAKEDNFSLLLVPRGLGEEATNIKRVKKCYSLDSKEYCRVSYLGEMISIGEEIGIEVKEVDTIHDAVRYFL